MNKKFLTILLSVLLPTFLVGAVVSATTSVGDAVSVGTTLAVTGATTLNGNVTLGDDVNDILTPTGYFTYLRVGTSTTFGHIAAVGADELGVEGNVEIDGTTYLDGAVILASTLDVAGVVGMGSQGSGVALTTASPFGFDLHVMPVTEITAGATGMACGIRMRYEVGFDQVSSLSTIAIDGRLRVKKDLGDGVHAGVQGYIEADGGSDTVISGTATTQTAGGHFAIELGTGVEVSTGWLTGVTVDSSVHSDATISGAEFAGVRVKKTGSAQDWEYGVHIADSTTGIDIGAATTGIALTGTQTTGIDMSGGTITTDIKLSSGGIILPSASGNTISLGDYDAGVGAKVLITAARADDTPGASGDNNESFFKVIGYLSGVGGASDGYLANTRVLDIDLSRTSATLWSSFQDTGLKMLLTNQADDNATNYILRGMNVEAKQGSSADSGTITKVEGMYLTAKHEGVGSTVTNLIGATIRADASPSVTLGTTVYGLQVDLDLDANAPAASAGVRAYYTSQGDYTDPLAAFQASTLDATNDWKYGLYLDSDSTSIADIMLSGGQVIASGSATTDTTIAAQVGTPADGSIYFSSNGTGEVWVKVSGTWTALTID